MAFYKTGDVKTATFYDDDGKKLSSEELDKLAEEVETEEDSEDE